MLKLTVLLVATLFYGFGFVITESDVDSYSTEVKALFKDLSKCSYKNNVALAKEKMRKFANVSMDRKYAIAIINLYTQESPFFLNLNKQMRNNYLNKSAYIWRRAGDLINRGLDILGPTLHKTVYRGSNTVDNLPIAGGEYRFNFITSTSVSRQQAEEFITGSNGVLFVIENVYGVLVEKYSYIPREKEVIIRSTNAFKVKSGPSKGKHYTIYHLDGRPNVNYVNRENAPIVNGFLNASVKGNFNTSAPVISGLYKVNVTYRPKVRNTNGIHRPSASNVNGDYRPGAMNANGVDRPSASNVNGDYRPGAMNANGVDRPTASNVNGDYRPGAMNENGVDRPTTPNVNGDYKLIRHDVNGVYRASAPNVNAAAELNVNGGHKSKTGTATKCALALGLILYLHELL